MEPSLDLPSMSSPDSLWSRYTGIHQFAMKPIHGLINLVGSKETTHKDLTTIIQNNLRACIHRPGTQSAFYAKPLYRIQSYDMPADCPRPTKKTQELGYIKTTFFDSFGYTKPAVTIFVFDWRKWAEYHPSTEPFDWKVHEQLILDQVREHGEHWQKDLQVASKFMILVLFPDSNIASDGKVNHYVQGINIEECKKSFRQAVTQAGDENIKSSNYFLSDGLTSLSTTGQKKFAKNLHELFVAYYREKKSNIKKKQKKLIQGQMQHVRYSMKSALFSMLTSNDINKALKRLDLSYQQLRSTTSLHSSAKVSIEERRDNADIIAIFMMKMHLQSLNLQKYIEVQRNHFYSYSSNIESLKPEAKLEEIKWRAMWFYINGTLLEEYYRSIGGLQVSPINWHQHNSMDTFPGHYFMQCMLQLIARKQTLKKLKVDAMAENRELYNSEEMKKIISKTNPVIGKKITLHDGTDPLGSKLTYSSETFLEVLAKYKIFLEDSIPQQQINSMILTQAHKAIGYFKQRSQLVKGNLGALHARMIHFINYHISELLKNEPPVEGVPGVEPIEDKSEELVNISERQKIRKQISDSMIKEDWTEQGIYFVEKAKEASQNLEEFFKNEMKVLIHDKNLTSHKRHARLLKLIEKVKAERDPQANKPLKLVGMITGCGLFWARARFEHKKVQVNKFNKLTLEIFSKISKPVRIQAVQLKLSQSRLNQTVTFESEEGKVFTFSKSNPMKIEREFYLENEDNQIGCIMLNQILLEVATVPQAAEDSQINSKAFNQLNFSLSPYLTPPREDEIFDPTGGAYKEKVKRLPPPIMYTIEPMPHKIKFNFESGQSKDQALIGDPYFLDIGFELQENVQLKSLKATIVDIETLPLSNADTFNQLQKSPTKRESTFNGMQSINLNASQSSLSPTKQSREAERLSASLFSFDVSKSAFGSSFGQNGSMFIGADRSVGVAVIRHKLLSTYEKIESKKAGGDIVNEDEETTEVTESIFEDTTQESSLVEVDYQVSASSQTNSEMQKLDVYSDQSRAIDLPVDTSNLRLKMLFYQENQLNKLHLKFDYSFTQNHGLEQEQVHSKSYTRSPLIKAQSPFKIEWQVKHSNSFLASLQFYFSQKLGALKNIEQIASVIAGKSGESVFNSALPVKDQMLAIGGDMVTPCEQDCWLVCKVTSQSVQKAVSLSKLDMEINPDYCDFISKLEKVDYEDGQIVLEPGESYEVLFKVKIGKIPNEYLDKFELMEGDGGNLARSQLLAKQPTQPAPKSKEKVEEGDFNWVKEKAGVVEHWAKYYKLCEIDHFAEVQFKWSSVNDPNASNLIDFSPVKDEAEQQKITCAIGSPSIHLVTVPIKVQIKNANALNRILVNQPFTVEYEIINLSQECILASTVLRVSDMNGKPDYMIAGELESAINLMPNDFGEPYVLRYTFFPQRLGRQSLPKLCITDRSEHRIVLIRDFTQKVYVTSSPNQ